MTGNSSTPSTGSATGSSPGRRHSLRLTLTLAFIVVALISVLAAALTANLVARSRVNRVNRYFSECRGGRMNGQYAGPTSQGTLNSVNQGFFIGAGVAILLGLLMSFFLARELSRPLSDLTGAAVGIRAGDYSHRVEAKGGAEMEDLAEAINELAESLQTNEMLRRHMVDDLRQFAQVESGQLELELLPVDIEEAIKGAAGRSAREAEAASVSLTTHVEPGMPAANADPVRLAQVLANLIKNAVAHTPVGGSVTLAARRERGLARIEVSDTGEGIAPEDLPYVFERFYRAEPARERATGGAGIGLTIARSLVEVHGGTITADSGPGRGTTVTFTIPLLEGEEQD